jgi:ATP-dependent DNA ligase
MVTNDHSHVKVLGIRPFETVDAMWEYFHKVRYEGFEGLMLRTRTSGYETGVRSSSLIKIKAFEDDEFLVVDLKASKEGWAICQCVTKEGKIFGVSAPGNKEEKLYVMRNPSKFIGRYLTVDYSHLTESNIPFHPTAIRWREDV